MYYVYKNASNATFVFDFGASLDVNGSTLVAKAVYEHKPLPAVVTDISNKIHEYFLLSDRVTSVTTEMGTIAFLQPLEGSYAAVYTANGTYKLYSASTNVFVSTSVTSGDRVVTPPNVPTPLPATVSRQTTGDGLQPPNGSENSAKQQTPPDKVVTPNTPTPLPQIQYQMPSTVSATTLATTPCAGPYADAINTYNTHVQKAPIMGKPIACSTAATEAKTKLTVTITPSVPIVPGSVTFKDVPMEKKDDAWFGFMMIAPTTVSSSQWIQLEVKEQKLSYTACLGQCDATSPAMSPKYEQKKDLEVKHDKDKKYKFEGGTVEYTEENPFNKGNLTLILLLSIGIPALVFIAIVIAVLVFANRGSVGKGVDAITTQMRAARDNAFRQLQSWRGNSDISSQMDSSYT